MINLIDVKKNKEYISNDVTYLITIANKGNIFENNIEHIYKISEIVEQKLSEKLQKYNPIKKESQFVRDMYYSQIRDKNNTFEKIYTCNYNFKTEFKSTYTFYLFEPNYTNCDKLTFPNLSKYHLTTNIVQKILQIGNIKIIIENNSVFIEFKNANLDILNDILNILNTFAS
jgi:hypothetical protein